MKRIISLLCIFSLTVLIFTACGETDTVKNYPLTVNGTPVDGEIFKYYLDEAFSEAEEQTKESIVTYATNACIRYVATNSTFAAKGLSLSAGDTVSVSEEANALWNLFGEHYTAVGVSKETYIKIRTNAAYTEKLRLALFDTDGVTPIADTKLKEYFSQNYVAFKLVRGYLFDTDIYGNTVQYSQDELQSIIKKFNNAVNQINGNTSIEYIYPTLVGSGEQEMEQALKTQVIQDADPYYPEGFYSKVKEVDVGTANVCIFGDYIYLIYRVDILGDEQLFSDYRSECLKAVSEIPLQSEINVMCNAYTSVRAPGVVNSYYSEVKKAKRNS